MSHSLCRFRQFCRSSIGRKFIVATTGILLCLFVLVHVCANMLILVSPEAYNAYAFSLARSPWFFYSAESALLAIFAIHIAAAIGLSWDNRRARPFGPERATGAKAASWASRSMVYTGALTLVFLVLHLISFRFGTHYETVHGGVVMRDLHRLVIEKFSDPYYVGWYLFSMGVLWLHLNHGVSAVFQSLGGGSAAVLRLRAVAYVFATGVVMGFISQPLYVFFGGGR